jgi:hypothetical protein
MVMLSAWYIAEAAARSSETHLTLWNAKALFSLIGMPATTQ